MKQIKIYGDGNQSRDFTFISDIVDANISASTSYIHGNTLNIGGGSVHSIKNVLKTISDITGMENIISYEPISKGDVIRTEANITKAQKIIKYKPKISLKEGLIKQTSWIKNEFP